MAESAGHNNHRNWRKQAQNELQLNTLPLFKEQQLVKMCTIGFRFFWVFLKLIFLDTAIDPVTEEVNKYTENHIAQYTCYANVTNQQITKVLLLYIANKCLVYLLPGRLQAVHKRVWRETNPEPAECHFGDAKPLCKFKKKIYIEKPLCKFKKKKFI